MNSPVAIVVLAAGSSSRMGQSKQQLLIAGEPLLLRSSRIAIASGADSVIVVLGSNAEAHKKIVGHLPLTSTQNPAWQKGIGNSLKWGLDQALKFRPETGAVIVMVCDQPKLTSEHLKDLINTYHDTRSKIVASSYSGTLGVPVLFDRSVFPELQSLEDEQGAKKVLNQHAGSIQSVNFAGGETDLDTWEDFQAFIQQSHR